MAILFHYTDKEGFDAIRSQPTWLFKASQPRGDHPFGAYFTPLPETTVLLANKLRIPKRKLEYMFSFQDAGDLKEIRGERGAVCHYSPQDYPVERPRQVEARQTSKPV